MDDLRTLLSQDFVEKLIKQPLRGKDRDYKEGWLNYENFADFYVEWKSRFVMPFSRVELLAERVLHLYVMRQIGEFLASRGYPGDSQAVNDLVLATIQADSRRLLTLLRKHWPAEWADIEKRNSAGMAGFGLR